MRTIIIILFLFWLACSCSSGRVLEDRMNNNLNVVDYGAVGDGKTEATQAFEKAWEDLCTARGPMPTLLVPKGETFLLQSISFRGPCNSNNVHLQIEGNIVAPSSIDGYVVNKDKWIQFSNVDGLIIDGGGKIDGEGHAWWKVWEESRGCHRSTALYFRKCNGLRLSHITHVNSQKNHISIHECNDVKVSNLHIFAPKDSPNTDGIDISGSTDVHIENSVIATGDDCIAINNLCSNISVTGITCGPGHGISIGSLGRNGAYAMVEDIHVRNCTFNRTQNGARIKTWQEGKGYVRKISFEQIILEACRYPIIIDQHYVDNSLQDLQEPDIHISDVTYRDIHGTSADKRGINLDCNSDGCTNIVMENINIASAHGMRARAHCRNVHGTSNSVTPNVPCLSKCSCQI